jgi:hypothetical protein
MSKVYKIHPGMGFARVGPSRQGYFLAGEALGADPVDINAAGDEAPFAGYKDASKMMRRQGARFRVYEYDRNDGTGGLTLTREITAAEAEIDWAVVLTSAKAAGKLMTVIVGPDGARTLVPDTPDRNDAPPGFTRADLKATVELKAKGKNAGPAPGAEPVGKIVGKSLFIGEARTDSAGRLVVLGGRGDALSWATPASPIPEFLNNPTWYDDIADGSVDAKVTFPGQAPINAVGAWVFTAPPDFAPEISPLTTLFDIVEQAANAPLPASLTYPQDIEPILRRAANLYFVNRRSVWELAFKDMRDLSGLGSNGSASAANRKKVRDDLLLAETQMNDFRLTERQRKILDAWVAGSFQEQTDPGRPALSPAAGLDRASLEHCVGGGFFPGIEAGSVLRRPTIYSEQGRITRGNFTDYDGSVHQIVPGLMSSRMACPWQADFTECRRNWWPSQRPDITGRSATGAPLPDWERGILVTPAGDDTKSHENMISHFAQLGMVLGSPAAGFKEADRDPALDTMT